MKKFAGAFGVVLAVAVLSGCATTIHSGIVTGKVVEEEQQYPHLITFAGETPVFEVRTDDEDYCLQLDEKGKTGYECVSKEVFDGLSVNDYYSGN